MLAHQPDFRAQTQGKKKQRDKSWKYKKLFHNFKQIFGQGHKERNKLREKFGNMKSFFTIYTEFSGEDKHKQPRRIKCDESFQKQ